MKRYESVGAFSLIPKLPVIIRIDGKAFHTWTKHLGPFCEEMHLLRERTLIDLVNSIDGCVLGYAQSDEFSLLLKDWSTLKMQPWFNYDGNKLVSVSASKTTALWNHYVRKFPATAQLLVEGKITDVAEFDSRAWNLPVHEVINYFIWRQKDWERNSIQMLARQFYQHRELMGLSNKALIAKMEKEQAIPWCNLKPWKKQGITYVRGQATVFDSLIFHSAEGRELVTDLAETVK